MSTQIPNLSESADHIMITDIALSLLGNNYFDADGNAVPDLAAFFDMPTTSTSEEIEKFKKIKPNLRELIGFIDHKTTNLTNVKLPQEVIVIDSSSSDDDDYNVDKVVFQSKQQKQEPIPSTSKTAFMMRPPVIDNERNTSMIAPTTCSPISNNPINIATITTKQNNPINTATITTQQNNRITNIINDAPQNNINSNNKSIDTLQLQLRSVSINENQTMKMSLKKERQEIMSLIKNKGDTPSDVRIKRLLDLSENEFELMKIQVTELKKKFLETNEKIIMLHNLEPKDFLKKFYFQYEKSLNEESEVLLSFLKTLKSDEDIISNCLYSYLQAIDDIRCAKDNIQF